MTFGTDGINVLKEIRTTEITDKKCLFTKVTLLMALTSYDGFGQSKLIEWGKVASRDSFLARLKKCSPL